MRSKLTTTTARMERRTISRRKTNHGIVHGYRSGLEDAISRQISDAGIDVLYECERINYTWPERSSTYCPDFKLPKPGGFFFLETKGRFCVSDRSKMLLVKEQHPDIDIRLLFQNPNAKLYKGSKTTYAMWADKHGFQWAAKRIPDDWLYKQENEIVAE